MLAVVDTPYRGGVLCYVVVHYAPYLYGVSTTVVRIGSLACNRLKSPLDFYHASYISPRMS